MLATLGASSARLCIELVPHELWAGMALSNLSALLGPSSDVSVNISTLQRVLGLRPDTNDTSSSRMSLLADRALAALKGKNIYVRLEGERMDQTLICRRDGTKELRTYDISAFARKAIGERLFCEEVLGVEAARLLSAELI